MRYYPIFLDTAARTVVFSGAGEHAAAKIALLLKTEARIVVCGEAPCERVLDWAAGDHIVLHARALQPCDVMGASLVYGANDDPELDARAQEIGRRAGALTNIVDNLDASEFLTPALVDRDPVVVAIGTEGTAPVLARSIKRDVEAMLPATTGRLARIANAFRPRAFRLGSTERRRLFWARWFGGEGAAALAEGTAEARLETLFHEVKTETARPGHVALVGAGPGDPELLTRRAARALHEADVVIHDRLVTPEILELARREATMIDVGKTGFGPSWKQGDIDALMIEHAREGAQVVRLKSGDPSVFGRLDEETAALDAAGIAWSVVPGITAASAAAADIGVSLTRRGRNSALTVLTGHDVDGFAEQDWRRMAQPGQAAAIYMGKRASTFLRGRLLMFGAAPDTPVTVVFKASRGDRTIVGTTLLGLPEAVEGDGPAVILFGLAPRAAEAHVAQLEEMQA